MIDLSEQRSKIQEPSEPKMGNGKPLSQKKTKNNRIPASKKHDVVHNLKKTKECDKKPSHDNKSDIQYSSFKINDDGRYPSINNKADGKYLRSIKKNARKPTVGRGKHRVPPQCCTVEENSPPEKFDDDRDPSQKNKPKIKLRLERQIMNGFR